MGGSHHLFRTMQPPPALLFFFFFLLVTGFAASKTFISDEVFPSINNNGESSTGRHVLQVKRDCPHSFEFDDYTILTSKCKPPGYPTGPCCQAFKEFICPFADLLNNGSYDCTTPMNTYIGLRGHYPTGLFASLCKDGIEGLSCINVTTTQNSTNNQSVAQWDHRLSPHLAVLLVGLLILVFF